MSYAYLFKYIIIGDTGELLIISPKCCEIFSGLLTFVLIIDFLSLQIYAFMRFKYTLERQNKDYSI